MKSDTQLGRTSKRRILSVAGVTFVLCMSHVLSIGPFARLNRSGHIPAWATDVAAVIYAPVLWVADHTALDYPFDWYLGLWLPEDTPKTR